MKKTNNIYFLFKNNYNCNNEQAEDRITPTTEQKVHKHDIVTFVCQNTVDEMIDKLLDSKKSITDLINEGGMDAVKKLLHGS